MKLPSIEKPQLERRLWIGSRRLKTPAAHVAEHVKATLASECDLSAHQSRDARVKVATESER